MCMEFKRNANIDNRNNGLIGRRKLVRIIARRDDRLFHLRSIDLDLSGLFVNLRFDAH